MNVARQLFELQEVDLELESKNLAIKDMTARLGESQVLREARTRLDIEKKHLEDLGREQRLLETDIEDLSIKLTAAEKELYSGRIRVPKELGNLQQEVAAQKTRCSQLEDKDLEIMEQVEDSKNKLEKLTLELGRIEADWHSEQAMLVKALDEANSAVAVLDKKLKESAAGVEASTLDLYRTLRRQKGTAVARVEQGICRGCRISLPVNELQLVRTGQFVRCGSCGRILYQA